MAPTLIIVVDTEEEFDWSAPFDPASTAVTNIGHQGFAQEVFDRHGAVPTYVVDYPVASTPAAASVLRGYLEDGRCDIGAHLHPWVTPPAEGPVDDRHSFPGNLPPALERRKLAALTGMIAEAFGRSPTIYKAGRYGIGVATPALLAELGYGVDVSVVPHTDFSPVHGPDFRAAPAGPYLIAPGLCELPLSVHYTGALAAWGRQLHPALSSRIAGRLHLPGLCARLRLLGRLRLSPEGNRLADMIRQTRAGLAAGDLVFMLAYHSSALLPGATQYVRDAAERAAFVATLDGYLRFFREEVGGCVRSVADVAACLTPG